MTFEEIFQPSVAPVAGAIITAIVSIQMMFLKWLTQSFRDLRIEIRLLNENMTKWLDAHESLDQGRHEENLYRFERVAVALAKLGSDNGTKEKHV